MIAAPRLVEGEAVVRLVVNGEERRAIAEPRMLLATSFVTSFGLTGTHVGCEQGVCGACTVRMDGEIVRSCLLFAVQAVGSRIETIEGLASGDELHPVQHAYHEKYGLQCGYCTPGLVLATVALLERNPDPSEAEIREHLAGNVCRCTGYVGIVASVQEAAGSSQEGRNVAATETEGYVGRRIPPFESAKYLRGRGKYVDDIQLPGMLHAAFLRSPFAHAKVTRVDADGCPSGPRRRRARAHSAADSERKSGDRTPTSPREGGECEQPSECCPPRRFASSARPLAVRHRDHPATWPRTQQLIDVEYEH